MNRPERPPLPLPDAAPLAPPADLDARLADLHVTLDADAVARLADYLGRLLAMNERVNLTAITDPLEAWTRHAVDALTLVPLLADVPAGAPVIDIGSGGGVPGIPLAIARPDLRVTLVEATQKKAAFLTAVSAALGLTNVTVIAERAEQLISVQRGRFDVVTARAVGRLVALVPITLPFAKPGGRAILIKGQRAEEELAEAAHIIGRSRATHEKTVATPTGRIVVLRLAPRR
jgi:16S rRNA (guanine527-N7)-methyltransferase